jgi:hypothetical protein
MKSSQAVILKSGWMRNNCRRGSTRLIGPPDFGSGCLQQDKPWTITRHARRNGLELLDCLLVPAKEVVRLPETMQVDRRIEWVEAHDALCVG